jgi:hypothetical protein
MQLMTFIILLSRSVQDINYLNGNLGKTAVGNFSLDMILNSLGQYVKTPLYFQYKVAQEGGGFTYQELLLKHLVLLVIILMILI